MPFSIDYKEMLFPDVKTIWKKWGRKVGKGYVLILPGGTKLMQVQADVVAHISENLADYLPGGQNSYRIQNGFDSSFASLFRNRILYYNPTDKAITKKVALSPADFEGVLGKPEKFSFQLMIPPHTIMNVPLRQIPVQSSKRKPHK